MQATGGGLRRGKKRTFLLRDLGSFRQVRPVTAAKHLQKHLSEGRKRSGARGKRTQEPKTAPPGQRGTAEHGSNQVGTKRREKSVKNLLGVQVHRRSHTLSAWEDRSENSRIE